ncbi:MAG: carboxypeptidase regulatory-like domain-containing protein [Armatimonadota bacterium]
MQKARWITLLAIVCICVMSISAYAQLPSTNWPKSGRDYYNSSKSPATSIAKPAPSWRHTIEVVQGEIPSYEGVKIGPDGNIYVQWDDYFGLGKYSSADGSQMWQASGFTSNDNHGWYNGPTIWSNGTTEMILAWMGGEDDDGGNPPVYSNSHATIGAGNTSTGAFIWESEALNDPSTGHSSLGGYRGYGTNSSAAVGPDGTIYLGNMLYSFYGPYGPLKAINPSNGTVNWTYNTYGVGRSLGSCAVKQVSYGGGLKNVIYNSGGVYYEECAPGEFMNDLFAVRDDGTNATLLWTADYTNTGFFTSGPVLSGDGATLYVAGRDGWAWHSENTNVIYTYPDTLFAYNADTGAKKWSIQTGGTHAVSPALGADGTIYVVGGHFRTGAKTDVPPINTPGKVIAVTDNGSSATVKWTYELPDDVDSDTSALATINTTPTVIYVATGNGRLFCIQDQGTYGKLLWTWQATDLKFCCWGSVGYTPPTPAVADDGTLYVAFNDQLFKFPAGFNPNSPEGISGTVKDADGNPIAGAWVSASTSTNPLADNASRFWTKTNPDGSYQISPDTVGTYYVAASAVGYEGSANQTAAINAFTDKITKDFTLGKAKFNWAIGSSVTSTDENSSYPAVNIVDGFATGDTATRFASTGSAPVLTIDLGQERSVNEAVIYSWWMCPSSYSLEYSKNGTDWTTPGIYGKPYETTAGNGGFPIDWYAADPTISGPPYAAVNVGPGGQKTAVAVIKFPSVSAQYWRLNVSAASYGVVGSYTSTKNGSPYASIWEVELRDPSKEALEPTIAGAKSGEEGDPVKVNGAVVTATAGGGVATDTIFVEEANRTAGIKVQMTGMPATIQFGDKVNIAGKIYTANGEKYIAATSISRATTTASPDGPAVAELSMNNKAAGDSVSQGMFIKTWGKVSDSATGSFKISDGSASPIKVLCSSTATMPADNDYIRVRGVVGKDLDGTVLYMRDERADWAYDSDDMHALPFTGAYDYPIQYLVLGPYTDEGKTRTQLLAEDFIGETSIGTTIMPADGLATAGKTWFTATSADGILDLNAAFGGVTPNAVAYVYLYVWSETASPSVGLVTGSDDALKYFVNGAQAFSIDAARGCTIGIDGPTAITLNKGLNSILFKVVNGDGGFALASQIVDVEAYGGTGYGGYTPFAGLGYSLNPATP